jgi:antitoxin VapB
MATTLNVRNPRAHQLASELAARRKTGITEAVVTALENELARDNIPLAERLKAIAQRGLAQAKPGGRAISEEERDEMWTR